MIGFTMINVGGQTLGMSLLPLQGMISKIFNMPPVSADIGAAQAKSLTGIGTEMALIFALGFLVNLLLARFTRFKYVHLSAHVSFFYAGLIAALLKFGTNLAFVPLVITGSLLLGIYMTFSCAYVAVFMKEVKGGEGFTEYSLKLDSNPEFTSSVLVAYALAAYRMGQEGLCGCKTVFDVAPAYLSEMSEEEMRKLLL